MKSSDKLIKYIKTAEGFSALPYVDDDPHTERTEYSIGYGHQIQPDEEYLMSGISEGKADELLHKDLIRYEAAVARIIKIKLTQGEFDALVDFAFNCGIGRLETSTLAKKINSQAPSAEINTEFSKWVYVNHIVSTALVQRRSDEVGMFLLS
jgi:lysozyme